MVICQPWAFWSSWTLVGLTGSCPQTKSRPKGFGWEQTLFPVEPEWGHMGQFSLVCKHQTFSTFSALGRRGEGKARHEHWLDIDQVAEKEIQIDGGQINCPRSGSEQRAEPRFWLWGSCSFFYAKLPTCVRENQEMSSDQIKITKQWKKQDQNCMSQSPRLGHCHFERVTSCTPQSCLMITKSANVDKRDEFWCHLCSHLPPSLS